MWASITPVSRSALSLEVGVHHLGVSMQMSPCPWSLLAPVMLTGLCLGSVFVLLRGMDQLSLHPLPHLEMVKEIHQPSAAH